MISCSNWNYILRADSDGKMYDEYDRYNLKIYNDGDEMIQNYNNQTDCRKHINVENAHKIAEKAEVGDKDGNILGKFVNNEINLTWKFFIIINT